MNEILEGSIFKPMESPNSYSIRTIYSHSYVRVHFPNIREMIIIPTQSGKLNTLIVTKVLTKVRDMQRDLRNSGRC